MIEKPQSLPTVFLSLSPYQWIIAWPSVISSTTLENNMIKQRQEVLEFVPVVENMAVKILPLKREMSGHLFDI